MLFNWLDMHCICTVKATQASAAAAARASQPGQTRASHQNCLLCRLWHLQSRTKGDRDGRAGSDGAGGMPQNRMLLTDSHGVCAEPKPQAIAAVEAVAAAAQEVGHLTAPAAAPEGTATTVNMRESSKSARCPTRARAGFSGGSAAALRCGAEYCRGRAI